MGKLPSSPSKGQIATLIVKSKGGGKRKITFKATGKKGFGMWKITSNVKA